MLKRKKKVADADLEETEEDEEADEKDLKKKKREESAEKRRSAKTKDKAARWSGLILLCIMLVIGFLLWIGGEINSDTGFQTPSSQTNPGVRSPIPQTWAPSPGGGVIVR